jgi:phenylacetate-CoA ligase
MNIRKPIIYGLLYLTGSKIPSNLNEIEKASKLSIEEQKKYQEKKLKKLLLYVYNNVPYYKKTFSEKKVVVNGKVNLENFNKIPFLTKEIIRKEGKNLYSKQKRKGVYENTSGGSTGEPVRFLQDKYYDDWNIANKLYYNRKYGKDIGQSEIKLWGSDRDILVGNLTLKDRIINFLYNRKFFNCYNFSNNDIKKLIKLNNTYKPTSYWTYVEAIFELSKYINNNSIKVYSPKFIISTIGPLYDKTRKEIKKAFKTNVYNQYGSREVGWVCIEENENKGMNIMFWSNLIEINSNNELLITSLNNYSMPLIRYKIGDVADISISNKYEMGSIKSYLMIKNIMGRTLGFFKRKDGSLFHTHHIIQQLFFKDWIKKFQVIQKSTDLIMIKIVKNQDMPLIDKKNIEKDITKLTGKGIKIKWEFVKDIKPTKSGKYLYTVCEVK